MHLIVHVRSLLAVQVESLLEVGNSVQVETQAEESCLGTPVVLKNLISILTYVEKKYDLPPLPNPPGNPPANGGAPPIPAAGPCKLLDAVHVVNMDIIQ